VLQRCGKESAAGAPYFEGLLTELFQRAGRRIRRGQEEGVRGKKEPRPVWRAIPDEAAEALFSALRSNRDRALVSFWLSSGVRASELLGSNWTLHDLRHTAAARFLADPAFTLFDVQTILRHASVSTTQIYAQPKLEELVEKVLAHHSRPRQAPLSIEVHNA
jgi:site-specific recombinase XerC